jgi:predicted amidophosphoribosyltransferase
VPAPSLPPPPGLDGCVAVLAYEDGGRELVARLKYRNARSSLRWLAMEMAARVRPGSADAVTWAPTSDRRRRDRGYDQARLLAVAVARRLGVPCVSLLRRRAGAPQTGRAVADRWAGPHFTARRRAPGRVLVVDDVVTTGATLAAAARTLRGAGAREVWGIAAARTPPARRTVLKAAARSSDPSINGVHAGLKDRAVATGPGSAAERPARPEGSR